MLAGLSGARAADGAVASGLVLEDLGGKMEAFIKASAKFIQDTRVTERDIEEILKLKSAMEELNTKAEAWGEAAFESGKFDYEVLIQDAGYRAWAKTNGVVPKEFLQKIIRLQLFFARDEAAAGADQARKQLAGQLKELESMRSQLGEENYRQMKSMLEAGSSALAATQKAFTHLPQPVEAEQKLLKKYRDQLRKALQVDEKAEGE